MTSERRLHPAAAVVGGVRQLRDTALPILVAALVGGSGGGTGRGGLFAALGIAFSLALGVAGWRTTRYALTEGTLRLRTGVFSPDETLVPVDRIQAVDTVRGPLQRLFGVVALRVQTPGGGRDAEIVLSALTAGDARELRVLLGHPERERGQDVLALDRRGLAVAALTAPRVTILAPVLGLLGASLQGLLSDPERDLAVLGRVDSPMTFSVLVLLALGLAYALSVFGAVVAFSGFELEADGDRLRIRRGLLSLRTASVPLGRIDAVRIVEGPVRRPFGLALVALETAGLRGEDGAARTLFPLVRVQDVPALLARFVPDLGGSLDVDTLPPRRAGRRYLVGPVIVGTCLGGAAILAWGPPALPLLAATVGLGVLAGRGRKQAAGLGLRGDRLLLRGARLGTRTTLVVRRRRLQAHHVTVSPLQRRASLAGLHVALGSKRRMSVAHLDAAEAAAVFGALAPVSSRPALGIINPCPHPSRSAPAT